MPAQDSHAPPWHLLFLEEDASASCVPSWVWALVFLCLHTPEVMFHPASDQMLLTH